MKNKILKLFILVALAAGAFGRASAQDVSINILLVSDTLGDPVASIPQGQQGLIEVDICNNDFTLTVPVGKVDPLISIPNAISTIPNTPITAGLDAAYSNDANWQVLTNNGTNIRVKNTTAILPGTCSSYFVNVKGTAIGGPSTITGGLFFIGPPTTGDNPANNGSTSGISVTMALPVKLTSFTASKTSVTGQALLSWATASESNSGYFEIDRSTDGVNFNTVVGQVPAAGNSSSAKTYQLYDNAAPSGVDYYRLKEVDKDGSVSYSDIQPLDFGSTGLYSISPNPASSYIQLKGSTAGSLVRISTATGQLASETKLSVDAGYVSVSGLASGVYFVQLATAQGNVLYNGKFVK